MKDESLTDEARLWSQTRPQRVVVAEMLRLVLRPQSRSETLRFSGEKNLQ
jgi:hypothetical protein